MEVKFRIAASEDISFIVELGKIYCPREYISHSEIIENFALAPLVWNENWWERLRSFLNSYIIDNPDLIHVIELAESNQVIGYAVLGVDQESNDTKIYGTVHDILIHPEFNGRGFGKLFFNYIEDFFKHSKCSFVIFESGVHNHGAHHFFEKLNYEVVSKVFYKSL